MANQYGPTFIFLGWVFLFYGIVNFFIIIWHQYKYKETMATISSNREYRVRVGPKEIISFALVLDFTANRKNYQVKQDVGVEEWAYSKRQERYAVGKEIKIYYKRKNPNEINLDLRNFYKRSCMLCPFFITIGLISLLIRHYLIP